MRTCEIAYSYFDNADQERVLREIVEPLRFLLPEWLRSLSFSKVASKDNFALKCDVRREYRMAEICVQGSFFGQPKHTLRLMVIHEFIHLHHAYVNDFVRCRVQDYVKPHNADLNTAMQAEFTDHLEGFVQDFAYIIDDLISRAEPALSAQSASRAVPSFLAPKTCHICMKPIDPSCDPVEGPPGEWNHPECFPTLNRRKETP